MQAARFRHHGDQAASVCKHTPCSICGRGTQEAREAVPLTKEAWCPRGSGNLAAQSLWTLFATKHWVLGLQNTYSSTLSLHPSL